MKTYWRRIGSLCMAILLVVSTLYGLRTKAEGVAFNGFDIYQLVQEGQKSGNPAVEKTGEYIYTYDFSDTDGFNSKGIRHAGVMLYPEEITGDFEISAVLEPLTWYRLGTGAVAGIALFTMEDGKPSPLKYFSLVQRGDGTHQLTAYYYRYKDGWGLAALGTKADPGEDGSSEITLRRSGTTVSAIVNGTEIHSAVPGEEKNNYHEDMSGPVYLGLVWDGCDARFSGLKISTGENVLYDQAEDTSEQYLHQETPTAKPELTEEGKGVAWTFDIGQNGYDAMVIQVKDTTGAVLAESRILPGETSGIFEYEAEAELTFTAYGLYRSEGEVKEGPVTELTVVFTEVVAPTVTATVLGKDAVSLSWQLSPSAASYTVEYKKNAEDTWTSVPEAAYEETDGKCTYLVSGLEENTLYDFRVILVDAQEQTYPSETVSAQTEKDSTWKINIFGSSTKQPTEENIAAGIYNRVTENEDGTVLIEAVGGAGKLQDQHDGMSYYYATVPKGINATLSADIKVLYHGTTGTGGDNKQQSFGIMFRDVDTKLAGQTNAFSNMAALAPYDLGKPIRALYRTGITADSTDGKINKKELAPNAGEYPVVGNTYHMEMQVDNTGYHYRLTDETGTVNEYLLYHVDVPDLLFQLDPEQYHVGFFAAREAKILVSNIELTTRPASEDPPAEEKPEDKIVPSVIVTSVTETGKTAYALTLTSNITGTVKVQKGEETLLESGTVAVGNNSFDLTLETGVNELVVTVVPDTEGQALTSYDEIRLEHTVTVKVDLGEDGIIYVSPTAGSDGAGTKASPVALQTAANCVLPGQTIVMLEGEYSFDQMVTIPKSSSGTEENPVKLTTEGEVTLDFQGIGDGIMLDADYWTVENMTVQNSHDNGVHVRGSYNTLEHLTLIGNGDTGLQISGRSADSFADWPAYNTVRYCESYANSDPSGGDADGFAAKLCVNEGNVFDSCSAHHNSDDGWDLYVKNGTQMGSVTVRNCIAYSNGYNLDGSATKGDGNGFKLGGESVAVPHVIDNCAAYFNRVGGFTANSNPTFTMTNTTAYLNGGANYTFTQSDAADYTVTGAISVEGGKPDSNTTAVNDPSANIFSGNELATADLFVSTEAPEDTHYVDENGVDSPVNLGDFLRVKDPEQIHGGAYLHLAPLDEPPVIEMPELSAAMSNKGVVLSWTEIPEATKYEVSREDGSGSWTVLSDAVTTNKYTDAKPQMGTSYSYRMRACINDQWTDYTETLTITFNPFKDVADSASYFKALCWAFNNNIIGGTSSTAFSPNNNCTREQFAAMIWKLNGKQPAAELTNPFKDVAENNTFRNPIVWCYHHGIVVGTSSTTFTPKENITRWQIMAMLWRMVGKPKPTMTSNPFTDVKTKDAYYKAALWAYENNITSVETFKPKDNCTRWQLVVFLYKVNSIYKFIP